MGWGVSLEFLTGFAQKCWPDADVYMSPSTGDYVVSVRVSRKELLANRVEALRRVRAELTARPVKRRRLHWGRRWWRRA